MNAKTTKFLAMLAVLAVAFAGCAILFNEQQNDAASAEEVTKSTYPAGGANIVSIELEDSPNAKSVVLYTEGATIASPYAYFFAEDATITMSEKVLLSAPVMFFVLNGVTLDIIAPVDEKFTDHGLVEFVNVKSYDADEGIITLNATTTFTANGYAKALETVGSSTTYDGVVTISYEVGDSFSIKADKTAAKGFTLSAIDNLDIYSDTTLTGEFGTVTIMTAETELKLKDFTGKVTDGAAEVELVDFTGYIVEGDEVGTFTIEGWIAGTLKSINDPEKAIIGSIEFTKEGQYVTFGRGVELPAGVITFTRYINDVYSVTTTEGMIAGSNGTTIAAGENGLEFSGSIVISDEDSASQVSLTFSGAAKISGVVNVNNKTLEITSGGTGYQITLENLRFDNVGTDGITLSAEIVIEEQVTVNGDVLLNDNIIVAPGANMNVTGLTTAPASTDSSTGKIFVGKDASFRTKTFTTGDTTSDSAEFTYDDSRWATTAFIDSTGAIYLNQNKVTTASAAVVAYLYQIGAGTVSINSSICSTPSTYYIYNQVIPYLSLNPVDVVCTSTLAEKAVISLDGVSYTGGELSIGNQARYTIDYSTGVPEFTVVFKELYSVSVTEAYDANGKQKIAIFDADGNEVDMTRVQVTGTNDTYYVGIAKLVYNDDYTIQGVNENNKYTFTHESPAPSTNKIVFERETTYSESFTMIRALLDGTYDVPEITYTEGFAVELTVSLTDKNEQISEGDVFMYYVTAEKASADPEAEQAIPVTLGEKGKAVITGIYTNDYIFLKSDYVLFYKLDVVNNPAPTGIAFFAEDAEATDVIALDSDSWSTGYLITGVEPTSSGKSWTASFTAACVLDEIVISFEFGDVTTNDVPEVTVDFTTYCEESDHKQSVTIKSSDTEKTITVCVGEVYTITWDEIEGQLSQMTYLVVPAEESTETDDGEGPITVSIADVDNGTVTPSVATADVGDVVKLTAIPDMGYALKSITVTWDDDGDEGSLDATSGSFEMPDVGSATVVTVTAVFEAVDPAVYTKGEEMEAEEALAFTLYFEEAEIMVFENKTNADIITFTVGDYTVDVAKGETGELIVNNGANASEDAGTSPFAQGAPLELSIKGANISWFSYQFYTDSGKATDTDDTKASGTVSGTKTSTSYEDFIGNVDGVTKVTITDIQYTNILYLVKVEPGDHAAITNYDQSGYYNTYMVAYVQPEIGFEVFGVEYIYTDEEGNEIIKEATAQVSETGQEFYDYYMPAADIVLRPIVAKPTYEVTFVDQDGEEVEKIDVVPFSADPISIPAVFGYVATAATTDAEIEGDFVFDAESQTVTFEMPAAPVEIKVTYDMGGPYSEDMELFISKTTSGVKITIIANDDLPIQSGYITIDYWYVYEEDGIYGMEQVVLDPIEFATSGAGVIESTTISLAEEEFFGAIYYVSATFEPIDGDAMKSDYIAYQMA